MEIGLFKGYYRCVQAMPKPISLYSLQLPDEESNLSFQHRIEQAQIASPLSVLYGTGFARRNGGCSSRVRIETRSFGRVRWKIGGTIYRSETDDSPSITLYSAISAEAFSGSW
jgi:hypothetical protein